ncbi:rhodanese domain-containing protein [Haematococcus lacustris]|uniref:Rhodanese domain-containing protein n=1 Tax=Haematococcus lacustris TaxID=44745 RepID=A0A699Z3Z1_HAELA|nr:rhodanese domain-containing protein [Haematococcus lacustris]
MAQPLWQGLRYSVWPSPGGHAFPRLRLQYKPNLISLAGGLQGLPVTQPEARATPLKPTQWKQMIAEAQEKKVVVLDVRNDYEWDAGHFVGAGRPDEEVFAETPVGSSEQDVPSPLRGMDPDTPVMREGFGRP